jgi:hypothetical protein
MSVIYVLTSEGAPTPLEEARVREMIAVGELNPEGHYWKEGMTDWRPLREFGVVTPQPTIAAVPRSVAYSAIKNLEPLSTIVKVLVIASIPFAVLFLAFSSATLIFTWLRQFQSVVLVAHWTGIVGIVALIFNIGTAIPFLMWIYRVSFNCHIIAQGMKYSAGMAVGGFFIPFANLIYPCAAMQEIWKITHNPDRWHEGRASVLVGFWWAFWLLCGVLGEVLWLYPKMQVGEKLPGIILRLETISSVMIALECSKIILAILAFALVNNIANHQKAWANR